ncbi:MAG: hypothetical protein KGN80_09435 [Acidobacteriota bacterium]|nr:hypothetical protein [Acidobacteriota bacterium]
MKIPVAAAAGGSKPPRESDFQLYQGREWMDEGVHPPSAGIVMQVTDSVIENDDQFYIVIKVVTLFGAP